MSKKILIIGGGIIGLCSAYYLQKKGHKVTVIDKSDFSSGASFVNAGIITPSHIISLAAPGMINKGIKWMLNSTSPFSIKPRLDLDFLKWSLLFKKSSTYKKVASSIPVIKNINLLSKDLYEEMKASDDFSFFYQHKGLLMYYKTDKAGEEEWNTGKIAIKEGLKVELLTKKEVEWLEGLQNYLNTAPESMRNKARSKKLSSFTIGDYDITVYDEGKCRTYEDDHREAPDKGVCVFNSGSELFNLKFPFQIESTAG